MWWLVIPLAIAIAMAVLARKLTWWNRPDLDSMYKGICDEHRAASIFVEERLKNNPEKLIEAQKLLNEAGKRCGSGNLYDHSRPSVSEESSRQWYQEGFDLIEKARRIARIHDARK
jgi:hypothetical protein